MGIRENILASKPKIEEREIAGVPGMVRISSMTYGLFRSLLENEDGDSIALRACVVDETDRPCLTDDDIAALPMNIKQALVRAVLEVNGATPGN